MSERNVVFTRLPFRQRDQPFYYHLDRGSSRQIARQECACCVVRSNAYSVTLVFHIILLDSILRVYTIIW
jgi:hypothetical protein